MIFERKILVQLEKTESVWRIRYNLELQSKYREPNIVKVIKVSQIRWLGHVFQYSDENPVKKITFRTPEGKRERGRPRTRWMDKVEKWLKVLGVSRWKNTASNRSRWYKLIDTAFDGNRLYCLERRTDRENFRIGFC
ncbi:uncharacterized protein TNCV_1036241 [Trichonephila clavipes]|nr:uncharacterized protein TNCV_1036241 [Trichonephila clavipes]